jgi:serine/threonine protein kinase/Tol biopolymer transport system component
MSAKLERGSLLHKRYRIVEILGQGGMGSVYRAVDENLGVEVAVKENLFTTEDYARQFRLEAIILANLRHANLPRVTDHFVIEEQGQYLIMDYINGEDLRDRMERTGPISEEEGILIGAAMCNALFYLHTRKPSIIHRDLKPGNVRIAKDGHIYLVDFGLAKLVKEGQATTTGARAMTPGYSPPEQYGTARTGPWTDIYSLGATLYAALTGIIPEDGLARAMDNVELVPIRERNPKVSRKLAVAIEKAMAVHPEDRFESAEEFRQALLNSRGNTQRPEGEFVVAPPPQSQGSEENRNLANEIPKQTGNGLTPPPPSHPPRKSHTTSWWVFFSFFLLTLVMALISILVFWSPITKAFLGILNASTPNPLSISSQGTLAAQVLSSLPPATQSKSVTLRPFSATRTILPSYTPFLSSTPTETPKPSPTSLGGGYSQIAYASDLTGVPQIFVMNADGSNPRQVTNIMFGACQPAWSPDGDRLVFSSPCLKRQDQYPDANLYIINVDGSNLIPLETGADRNFDPAWSPDGTRIAFTSLRDSSPQIYVLTLRSNMVTRLTGASGDVRLPDWSMQPAWSPSGTQIVFTGHSILTNSLQIWAMSDAGLGPSLLIHRGSDLWNSLPDWSSDGKAILFSETLGAQELGWLMRFDIQTLDVVHLRTGASGTHGDTSADGAWVVYESKDSVDSSRQDYDIYRVKSDGTGAIIRLTSALSMEFDPAWRPIIMP